MGVLFFCCCCFFKKNRGLYHCELKNEMTLILEFFSRKKKNKKKQPKLARWARATRISCTVF